jgi:hypothetical protein
MIVEAVAHTSFDIDAVSSDIHTSPNVNVYILYVNVYRIPVTLSTSITCTSSLPTQAIDALRRERGHNAPSKPPHLCRPSLPWLAGGHIAPATQHVVSGRRATAGFAVA